MRLNLESFAGAVHLKDWIRDPRDGSTYLIVQGVVSIIPAKALGDFRPGSGEANWFARVENQDGTRSINILGCQTRAIEALHSYYSESRHIWSLVS